jgi:RNA polymerase sigma factor (TIGR02999 family)
MNSGSAPPATPDDPAFAEVYRRLHAVAQRERRRFGAHQTLNTTALVHEVYVELAAAGTTPQSMLDYFSYAARAMRNLMIDRARRASRVKHGGHLHRTDLDSPGAGGVLLDATHALELDDALRRLVEHDARAAEIVELHYFAGLELAKIAELLGVSERTINRDWRAARAWLQSELSP